MIELKENIAELSRQYKSMQENKAPRNIASEFSVRYKLRDLHNACKVCVINIIIRYWFFTYLFIYYVLFD